ncbi:MAG: hypothetical protein KDD61_18155 [Bdellovibrionales bacterium]|nr:hypothetical protein [Bdellovibrionales bacterium]
MKNSFVHQTVRLAVIVILGLAMGWMTACSKSDGRSRINNRGAANPQPPTKPEEQGKTEEGTPSPSAAPQLPTEPNLAEGSTLSLHINADELPISTQAISVNSPDDQTALEPPIASDGNPVTILYGSNGQQQHAHLDSCISVPASGSNVRCAPGGQPVRITDPGLRDQEQAPQEPVAVLPQPVPVAPDAEQVGSNPEDTNLAPAPIEPTEPSLKRYVMKVDFQQPRLQLSTDKVDVLFVVDTQKSFEWRERLKQVAHDFQTFLINVDPQIQVKAAVLPAHSNSRSALQGRLYNFEAPGSNTPSPKVLRNDVYKTADEFTSILMKRMEQIPDDPDGDGGQLGLASLKAALSTANLKEIRADNFLLPESALIVIFVSNENDICYNYPEGIRGNYTSVENDQREKSAKISNCNGVTPESVLKDILRVKKQRPVLLSGFLHNEEIKNAGENEKGRGYLELIHNDQTTYNSVQPISSASFNNGFSLLAQNTNLALKENKAHLYVRFPIDINVEQMVDLENIDVAVDGRKLDRRDIQKTLDGEGSTKLIVTIRDDQAGQSGSKIRIFVPYSVSN